MKILICSPYRSDKDLGRAYNETMALLPDDWWACFHDIDTLFLTPDCGTILETYAEQYPDAGILTCLTNRVSDLSAKQMLGGRRSEDPDIRHHIKIAQIQEQQLYDVTEINRDISGMLMMISKRTWKEMPFPEGGKCLGIDTHYNRRIREAVKKILRMNGLYIFHTYRLLTGIHNKMHLQ
jgi:GT2 family glycosyltransferase